MRAAIVDPYLDTVGGGERYAMSVAYVLQKNGWKVDVNWSTPKIGKWLEERLGLDFSKIEFVDNISRGLGYDLVFWLSDGSIPTLFAKRNVLHFQTPFKNVLGRNLFNRLKLAKISRIVCNSKFTKKYIDREFGVKSKVIYPPVAVSEFKPGKKQNLILFVGRYSQLQQAKRQDILIKTFKKMCDDGLSGWRLVLVGASDVGRTEYVDELKNEAQGYPIDVLENLPFSEIKKHYGKAKIFWSASGFGQSEELNPEKVEHFGITVVEAMAAGCVPIILDKGGHKEIVKNGENGFLWNSLKPLQVLTERVIKNKEERSRLAAEARKSAKRFSQERFEKEILQLVE